MQRLLALALIATSSCGGGRVDPGFYGGVMEEPEGPPAAEKPARGQPVAARPAPSTFERPKLVVIRAGWCPICRQVEPSVMSAWEAYRGKVDLVVLDVSDEAKVSQALADATEQGCRSFFEKYGARTPTVGIFVQPEKGRLVHGELSDPATTTRELENAVAQFGPAPSRAAPEPPATPAPGEPLPGDPPPPPVH